MRKLAMAFLFCLTSTIANAQDEISLVNKPVYCSSLKLVIETVTSPEYREEPVWSGRDEKSKYIMTANRKTGTWTFIQYNDNIACVIGVGDKGKMFIPGKPV